MRLYSEAQMKDCYVAGKKNGTWHQKQNLEDCPPNREEYLASVEPVHGMSNEVAKLKIITDARAAANKTESPHEALRIYETAMDQVEDMEK